MFYHHFYMANKNRKQKYNTHIRRRTKSTHIIRQTHNANLKTNTQFQIWKLIQNIIFRGQTHNSPNQETDRKCMPKSEDERVNPSVALKFIPKFGGVLVAQSLVFCADHCLSVCIFFLFGYYVVQNVILFMASDYPVGILKLFMQCGSKKSNLVICQKTNT